MKQEIIKQVKSHFDLNEYESKVWLALLQKHIATVGEIAELSGVPRSRVYDVLESLEKRGFAVTKLGKPIKYIAVRPSTVLEHMKMLALKQAEDKVKQLTELKGQQEYTQIERLYTKGIQPVRAEELSSAIKGKQNIYSSLKQLMGEAKRETILISTVEELRAKAKWLAPLIAKLRGQGVSVKLAVSGVEEDQKEQIIALSKEFQLPIKRLRIAVRLCIIDQAQLLIFTTPNDQEKDEEDLAISINSPFFARALTTFLNPAWRH